MLAWFGRTCFKYANINYLKKQMNFDFKKIAYALCIGLGVANVGFGLLGAVYAEFEQVAIQISTPNLTTNPFTEAKFEQYRQIKANAGIAFSVGLAGLGAWLFLSRK
jgi:hypothetical protein